MSRYLLTIREKHVIIYDSEEEVDILKYRKDDILNMEGLEKTVEILNKMYNISEIDAYDKGYDEGYDRGCTDTEWNAETGCCCGECD